MDNSVVEAEVGQWYARTDKGEVFQVVGLDETTGTVEIQTFYGDLDEIEPEAWRVLPLERIESPESWTRSMSDTDVTAADSTQPLQPIRQEGEPWQETEPDEERNAHGKDTPGGGSARAERL